MAMGWKAWAVVTVVGLAGLGSLGEEQPTPTETVAAPGNGRATPEDPAPSPASGPSANPTGVAVVLLFITDQKDGDSFVASNGNEYRLGLVNTPEASEQCGADAARFTRDFLADGFTADAYTTDPYGRRVAEVFDGSGRSLNVALAESGLGNDRYLDEFRHENPGLARRLDAAFASAPNASCRNAVPVPFARESEPPAQAGAECMPGYDPCLPVQGDMNCPDIGFPVRVSGGDPYGLDRDGDGVGCD